MTIRKCISIGPLCTAAQTLKDMGMRTEAYPFDWIFGSLEMVRDCIETDFDTLLDPNKITKYGSVFNHHDMTDADTRSAFERRSKRFMEAYSSSDGIGMMYMTKSASWWLGEHQLDREYLSKFSEFVATTSPRSVVIVVILCPSGETKHDVSRVADNCYVANVHYGSTDNLSAVRSVLDGIL